MRIRSFVTGAVLGAVALTCVTFTVSTSAAMRLQSMGAASQDTTTHFNGSDR